MPSHITHILLAKDIYEQGELTNISKDYFLTFSLGADLSKYSKVRKLSHKVKQKELIINMYEYLQINNLTTNGDLLATIYGHISHIVADNTIHPLIYQETRSCNNKKLKNHTLLESHYDAYLLREKMNLSIKDFKLKKYLKGRVSKVSNMLDYAYYKTYGHKHISRFYYLMLFLYRHYDLIYKFISTKILIKISKYHLFLKDNYLSIDNQEFMVLYQKSINDSLTYINKLNLK